MAKMEWLINILNGEEDTRPPGAKRITDWMLRHQRGLVIAPTGYGKSGLMFYYIVKRLEEAYRTGKKICFTLSTPLLVLNDQFYSDLVEVLSSLTNRIVTWENTVFVDNSSVIEQQRGVINRETMIPKWSVNDMKGAIENNTLPQFIFIISTHKSYNRLLSERENFILGQLRDKDYETVTIFDESHTIVDGTVTVQVDEERHDNRQDENDSLYMSELDKYADDIFLVSATPPKWQAEWIKEHY